jgi:hypothetical protein
MYLNNNENSGLLGKFARLGGSSQIYADNKSLFGSYLQF